jgi:hypothetical protein
VEHPAYSKELLTYIDILGFSDLIKESITTPSKIAEIEALLEQLIQIGDTARRHPKHSGQRFGSFNFSDLIVRSTSIESGMVWHDVVDWELFYLADQQMNLATQGVLLRGGISIGDIYVSAETRGSKRILFGPALVRSYKLESNYAIYPRIVIDRALIVEAEERGLMPVIGDFIRRGEDGVYFLDYFFAACINGLLLFPERDDVRAQINSHRKAIEMMIGGNQTRDERIRQKQVWLTLYHNSTVRRFVERIGRDRLGSTVELMLPDDLA